MDCRPSMDGHTCCPETASQPFLPAYDFYPLWPSVGFGGSRGVTWDSRVVLSPGLPAGKTSKLGLPHHYTRGHQLVLINRVQINLERWNEAYFPGPLSEKGQILRDAIADKHVV